MNQIETMSEALEMMVKETFNDKGWVGPVLTALTESQNLEFIGLENNPSRWKFPSRWVYFSWFKNYNSRVIENSSA